MPRKDPVTGCNVMTTAEFFADEAKREGKGRSGGKLMDEFMDDMEKDRKATEDRFREPIVALDVLKSAIERGNDGSDVFFPQVAEVLEVLEAQYSQSTRDSSLWLRARCRRVDGVEDVACFGESHSAGGQLEPPDYDENFYWEGIDDEGEAVIWRHVYTIGKGLDADARRKKCEWMLKAILQGGIRVRIVKGPFESAGDDLQVSKKHYSDAMAAIGRKIINLDSRHSLFDFFPER
jgi:hypothetical protein